MLIVESIPQEQKDLIVEALSLLEDKYKAFLKRNEADMDAAHKAFDAMTLKAIMRYDVEFAMSQDDFKTFTARNGVDFPQYTSK